MTEDRKNDVMRETAVMASLDIVRLHCARQCRAIASACLDLQHDPIFEDLLEGDALRLSSVAKRLSADSQEVQGIQMLQLAVTRRLILQIIERKEVVIWMARTHSEALSVLLNAIEFEFLKLIDFEDEFMPTRPTGRRRGI
jgi:hypothetical protein